VPRTPRASITDEVDIVDPTVNDDDTRGFDVGSRWTNTALDKVFFCTDNSSGAAVWKDVSTSGAGGHIFEDEGVTVPGGPHTVANFKGPGVKLENAGSGVVDIKIPLSRAAVYAGYV